MSFARLFFAALAAMMMLTALAVRADNPRYATADYRTVPLPRQIAPSPGEPFRLSGATVLRADSANSGNAAILADWLQRYAGIRPGSIAGVEGGAVVLAIDPEADPAAGDNPEAYRISVTPDGVRLTAPTSEGVFRAITTLRKSFAPGSYDCVLLPPVEIADHPRFAYRGAHFDVSRHFFTTDSVLRFIDMMALHGLNRLHWHLTDDQGWRVEMRRRPELTRKGSLRSGTVIGHNSGRYDSIPHGGFYTRDDMKRVVDYARSRHIEVIPEIDMPGHMQAALAAYPHLGCTGGPYDIWQMWGVSDDVLCAGSDSVLRFIDDILTELTEIFPSHYIHVGGDECPKTRWKECPACQARIRRLGLEDNEHGSAEEQLQSYIIRYASKVLAGLGRELIGWDEILEGGLAPGAVVMSWRGEQGGIQAARAGHDVIMTPNNPLYFDYSQNRDASLEPCGAGGYNPVDHVYRYDPVPSVLTPDERRHVLGVQANLWTEYIPDFKSVEYMELPRMAALSEIAWNDPSTRDYPDFLHRLDRLTAHYRADSLRYARHVWGVGGNLATDTARRVVTLTLYTPDNALIEYSLDGPAGERRRYEGPVTIDSEARIFATTGIPGRADYSDSIAMSLATFRPVTLLTEPHPRFRARGGATLTDGRFGPPEFGGDSWLGYLGQPLDAVIDLGDISRVSFVGLQTCVATGSWIMDADSVTVSVSTDGVNYKPVATQTYSQPGRHTSHISNRSLRFEPTDARFVRVVVAPPAELPSWHPGAGNPAFIFVDEITVR